MPHANDKMQSILTKLYGRKDGSRAYERIAALIEDSPRRVANGRGRFSQSDAVLITYGDTLRGPGKSPLAVLCEFARRYLKESFSAIHFLPFFPFSSDDGFSVIDFSQVNPDLGTWRDIERFTDDFELMFDYVLNHISARSGWFSNYLAERPGFDALAIEVSEDADLSMVTRPRTLPLLTDFKKTSGRKVWVWTTFSSDQVDLNYKSTDVLCSMVEVLLDYVAKGAAWIRMDAVAYLWKTIGTSCIHLPETHEVLRLLRLILDRVSPDVIMITETNVPHDENISYFGNGHDEAQLVYNFTLPPLLLHTFHMGDAGVLTQWAENLATSSDETTFFNFTASHDGIGVRPLEGILPQKQIDALADLAVRNGGRVSYKTNSDGTQSPYELNVTYVDALGGDARKFLASQAIGLALPGVPAVYVHSLLGSRNWEVGVLQTGRARTINRAQLQLDELSHELKDAKGGRAEIFFPYCHMLKIRRLQPAFHPNAGFSLISKEARIFGIERFGHGQRIFALTNISPNAARIAMDDRSDLDCMRDLISGEYFDPRQLNLDPYQCLWLEG